MSDLKLDVDQAGELKAAFRRTRGSGGKEWTSGYIKKLSEGNLLGSVLDVLDGRAKIVPNDITADKIDAIIRVDRTRTVYPRWIKKVMHPELDKFGPAEYDISIVERWFYDGQTRGGVMGHLIYDHLKKTGVLKYFLGLADLLVIQAKGSDFYRKYFAGEEVVGWKSAVWNLGINVPCLCGGENKVFLNWRSIDMCVFGLEHPALRFASERKFSGRTTDVGPGVLIYPESCLLRNDIGAERKCPLKRPYPS